MKKTVALLTLAALLFLAIAPVQAFADPRTITVSGSATVLTDADSARLMLGVVTFGKEASAASAENARQTDALIAALLTAGIEQKDITTSAYYVNTIYNYDKTDAAGNYQLAGYQVNNSLTVRVRDIDAVGKIIDIAQAGGATSCDGITFSAANAGQANDDALVAAIADARRKAAIVAEACGGKLGGILSVSENHSAASVYVNNKRSAMTEEAAEGQADTQIISEGLSFSATVTIVFELTA